MFVCAMLSVEILLALTRHFHASRVWLLAWSVATTVLYACHMLYFCRIEQVLPYTEPVYMTCHLMVYPLFLIYISRLTSERPLSERWPWMAMLLGLPVALGLGVGVLNFLMDDAQQQQFIRNYLYGPGCSLLHGLPLWQARLHGACSVVFTLFVVLTCIMGSRMLRRYNRQLEQFYADTEQRHQRMLQKMLWVMVVCSMFSIFVNIIGRQQFHGSSLGLVFASLIFSSVLFAIGWQGMTNRFTIDDMLHDMQEPKADGTGADSGEDTHEQEGYLGEPAASDSELRELMERIRSVTEEERLYLQHDLNLNMLAVHVGTNRTYLQRALRQQQHMTFSEFINRQRIAYAQQLQRDDPSVRKEELAWRSGYASLSAFYQNYRRYAKDIK